MCLVMVKIKKFIRVYKIYIKTHDYIYQTTSIFATQNWLHDFGTLFNIYQKRDHHHIRSWNNEVLSLSLILDINGLNTNASNNKYAAGIENCNAWIHE